MDRALSEQVVQQQKNRRWLIVLGIGILLMAGWWGVRSAFSNTIKRSEIRTAVVETGSVENTLTAVGEVQPEFEQLIASPIPAVIQRVLLEEGASVTAGQKIVELDKSATQLDYDKQKDQLELRRNSIVKLQLDLDKSFYDLKINDSIKAFRIEALKADIENAKRLFKAGGGVRETVDKLENDLHIARLEKRQLENDIRTRQAITRASIRETEITAAIQEKELNAFSQKLQKADIRAAAPGVLTYVNKNLGQQVQEGAPLARIANLNSYKVLASISDNYAAQLRSGMPVTVRIGETDLSGRLVNIHPAVANNVITFDIAFDGTNTANLRPRMKVEVFIITDQRNQTLRVANGPAFKGGSETDLFVLLPDGQAERRRVKTGLVGADFIEITSGLSVGETVIISDLSRYKNTTRLTVAKG